MLSAEEQTQVRGNIKRVIIRRASGPVLIETDKSETVEAKQGDNIRFENVCGVMSITNLSGVDNRLMLVLVADGEGDMTSTAEVMEMANAGEITAGAADFDIRSYTAVAGGVQVLFSGVSRRSALISTAGPVSVSKIQGGESFTVDGVLDHPAQGALWVSGDGVSVEVLEYLN